MKKKEENDHNEPIKDVEDLEMDSLLNRSKQELIMLAKNLSNGKYQKNSRQRDKILQLLVKQLSSPEATK